MANGINSLRTLTSQRNKALTETRCRHLLESARDSKDFVACIKKYFTNDQWRELLGGVNCSFNAGKLTEKEYISIPPIPHADALWQSLGHIKPVEAGKPETWLSVTLQAIQMGIIESHYLASKSGFSGIQGIERALRSEEKDSGTPAWLTVSRRILRRAFGFISERGRKAIFTDVPFAVVWWKTHLAKEISEGAQIPEAKVSSWMFDERSNSKYGELTMRMTGKLTVIADKNIRDGLFSFLLNGQPDNIGNDEFGALLKYIGIQASWKALGMLSPDENKKIIADCYNDILLKP